MSMPMPISRARLFSAMAASPTLDAARRPPLARALGGRLFFLPSQRAKVKRLLVAHGVDAPGAGAGGGEVEEGEAEKYDQLPTVEDREEVARRVGVEIRHGIHAREDKGHRPGEQADDQ